MKTGAITTRDLIERHRSLWRVMWRNPFIVGVRDGSLPVETFDRWLVQDRHFVDGLFPTACRILAAAPERDREVLLYALRDIEDNLRWFDRTLAARRLDPKAPVHPICRAYVDFTLALAYDGYPVGLVALWGQYRAYLDAWSWALPCAPRFRPVVRNWCSPGFRGFLRRLARAADQALAESSPLMIRRAEEALLQVAKYELAFWVMTMEEKPRASARLA
jgi:thiaminase/transcriptional activator TenA